MKESTRRFVDTVVFEWCVPHFVQARISRRAILYIVYGSFSTALDLFIFYAAGVWFALGYVAAATVSFFISGTTSFLLNKYLNYQNESERPALQYVVYFMIGASGLLMTYLLLHFFIDILGLHRMGAKVITSLILALYGYFAHSAITFKKI